MLKELNCEILDYSIDRNHWEDLVIAFRKGAPNPDFQDIAKPISKEQILKQYFLFKKSMQSMNEYLNSLSDEKVYGYGAALMLPILCYHLGNELKCLECIIDDDPQKEGFSYINLPVLIRHSSYIEDWRNSIFLITALDHIRKITAKLLKLSPRRILIPLNLI